MKTHWEAALKASGCADIQTTVEFEAAWHDRMGGDATRELRFMLGVTMARVTTGYNVHPRVLADYLRELLRLQEPDSFDKPS